MNLVKQTIQRQLFCSSVISRPLYYYVYTEIISAISKFLRLFCYDSWFTTFVHSTIFTACSNFNRIHTSINWFFKIKVRFKFIDINDLILILIITFWNYDFILLSGNRLYFQWYYHTFKASLVRWKESFSFKSLFQ